MNWGFAAGLFIAVFAATFVATKVVLASLHRQSLLDLPNERSSHTVPTPRGGGLAMLLVIVPTVLLLSMYDFISFEQAAFVGGLTILLGVVSWIDDVRGLGPLIRLGAHFLSVSTALYLGLVDGPVFGGLLPPVLDAVASAFVWVWFINLFNFMDGIDGIAGVETLSIGIGVALLAGVVGVTRIDSGFAYFGITIAAAAAGFLIWNWHPAKVFMGDVGSVPLGFMLGWMLLSLAAEGYLAAALIMPSYFLFDASVTLLRRLLQGQKAWEAHREHFYQQAVQSGKSHAEVSRAVLVVNIALIGLAVLTTTGYIWGPLVVALCIVVALVMYMRKPKHVSMSDGDTE